MLALFRQIKTGVSTLTLSNVLALIFGSVFLGLLSLSIYAFYDWKDPDTLSYYLASDMTETMIEQGLFYPANDLDDPLLNSRKIVINTGMNEHTSREVTRKLLYLNALDNEQPIDLYISSQGGWYDSAFTIIDTFHAIAAPVNTICIGGCYSASALLMAAGTGNRISYSNALFSIHIAYGSKGDGRPYSERPDRVNKAYQQLATLPEEWFPLEDDRFFNLTAAEAKDFGLIDEVLEQPHSQAE